MTTIKELKKQLDTEIDNRKGLEIFVKDLWEDFNDLNVEIKNALSKRKTLADIDKKDFEFKIKKIEKIKDQILGYTLQIIAIVVAILAVIMSLAFLSTDFYSCPNQFVWFLSGAIVYFLVIFTWWVLMWYKNTKTS